ncbi:hypothetical protein EDD85DRAFT_984101 [Armillaria nabsnona]|nr:hypothetical protein EDD85DRAFT_984101 [Armillaria nabsnona]
MSKVSIFFTGATGYIGGTILSCLIEHKDSKNFDITILLCPTRSPAGYEALGLKTISGSDADLLLLRAQVAAADIVFATADCDEVEGHYRAWHIRVLCDQRGKLKEQSF